LRKDSLAGKLPQFSFVFRAIGNYGRTVMIEYTDYGCISRQAAPRFA
jgi:hypothetical protein